MIKFFTDTTEVFFTCLDKPFNVSSVFCEFTLPFMDEPKRIYWYGVIIAFGFTLAVLFGGRTAYKWKIDLNKMTDVLIYGAFAGIIGARAYFVLSEWDYFSQRLPEIFMIWKGGLAIYGGLIGGIVAGLIICKIEKINILNVLDLCGMSFLIGQGIGRWGNFANQEAFGVNTSLPWGMYSAKTEAYLKRLVRSGSELIVDPSKPVHPTFLYESLWCLLSFLIIFIVYRRFRKFSGQLFLLYGVLYGYERTFVEGLRTDSLYIGDTNIRISQLVSVILVIVCGILLAVFTIKYTLHPKRIEGVDYFNEIPLYRNRKKAALASAAVDALNEKLVVMKAKADAETPDGLEKQKIEGLEEKLKKARATLLAAETKVKIQDEKEKAKAEKKAAKKRGLQGKKIDD